MHPIEACSPAKAPYTRTCRGMETRDANDKEESPKRFVTGIAKVVWEIVLLQLHGELTFPRP